VRWSSPKSPSALHFEGVPWGQLEHECMWSRREGRRLLAIFAQPKASHFQIFANEVSNFNRTCLRTCFNPKKKMPKNLQLSHSWFVYLGSISFGIVVSLKVVKKIEFGVSWSSKGGHQNNTCNCFRKSHWKSLHRSQKHKVSMIYKEKKAQNIRMVTDSLFRVPN
jgi:hypothetical protein